MPTVVDLVDYIIQLRVELEKRNQIIKQLEKANAELLEQTKKKKD